MLLSLDLYKAGSGRWPASARERDRGAGEGEHAPCVRVARTHELCSGAARKFRDDPRPEGQSALVPFGDADNPAAGKAAPEQHGRPATHAGAPVAAQDEEFSDVEDLRIVGRRGAPRDQREPRHLAVDRMRNGNRRSGSDQ